MRRWSVADVMARISPEPNTGCWLWIGSLDVNGYGRIGADQTKAHRAVYELFSGSIASGMLVCHRCDMPTCVNPRHLFLGTPLDNMRDKVRKGRMVGNFKPGFDARRGAGERSGNTKLTNAQVIEARRRMLAGEPVKAIAAEFGASHLVMWRIKRGLSWRAVR